MKYVASCSGGKDSVATLILAKQNNEPLDMVMFAEVMFDEETTGEMPEHRDFVYNILRPWVEKELGVPFVIVRSERHFVERYNHILCRGQNKGKRHGFPIPGLCMINRDCKLAPIKKFYKDLGEKEVIQYIGIAADEPKRLARLKDTEISLLDKYGYTEDMAAALCKEYGLYSPCYEFTDRNGCWFCCNCKKREWQHLIEAHPDLMDKLIQLEQVEVVNTKLTRSKTPSDIKAWIMEEQQSAEYQS